MFDVAAADWLLAVIGDEDLAACAIAAHALGCDSASLAALAMLREHDQGAILTQIFGTCRERNLEFPLGDEAFTRSYEGILRLMVEGRVTPEEASVKVWTLAHRDPRDTYDETLLEFKDLAIALDLHTDPECDHELDLDHWRADMLALARTALEGHNG